jgi:alkanesulfonate monooxygenase SsuD/methylene tetrahydromethanopterin reductase-like flavin-dependent oxidoreductase (luciferase family)
MTGDRLELGLVLPMLEEIESGEKPTWVTIKTVAQRAEAIGFDTVWVVDELLWKPPSWPGPRGFWEAASIAGAVAASTTTIGVGTCVLSAVHRNPGLTVKIAETLDEISGGRFLFGLGAGHGGPPVGRFGYPEDYTISRYEDALEIIVPALRGEVVTREGRYHRASDLEIRPRGPRPGRIPLMLAGHGPRTMRLAARHADIWSGFVTESSLPEAFVPLLDRLVETCADVGRDPDTLGRSIAVAVEPAGTGYSESVGFGRAISGSPEEITATLARFTEIGATRVEVMLMPDTGAALDALEPAIHSLRQ